MSSPIFMCNMLGPDVQHKKSHLKRSFWVVLLEHLILLAEGAKISKP